MIDGEYKECGVPCCYIAPIVSDDRMENTRSVVCQAVILLL